VDIKIKVMTLVIQYAIKDWSIEGLRLFKGNKLLAELQEGNPSYCSNATPEWLEGWCG